MTSEPSQASRGLDKGILSINRLSWTHTFLSSSKHVQQQDQHVAQNANSGILCRSRQLQVLAVTAHEGQVCMLDTRHCLGISTHPNLTHSDGHTQIWQPCSGHATSMHSLPSANPATRQESHNFVAFACCTIQALKPDSNQPVWHHLVRQVSGTC